MTTSRVQYCTHSRRTFMLHFIMMNNRKFGSFTDEYFDSLVDEMARIKNSLANEVPIDELKEEANILYKSSLGQL